VNRKGLSIDCRAPATCHGRRTIEGSLLVHQPSCGSLVLALQDLLEALVDVGRLSAVATDDELVCLELFRDRADVCLSLRQGVSGPEVGSFTLPNAELERQIAAAWRAAVHVAKEWDDRELLYELVVPSGAWYACYREAVAVGGRATDGNS
jgi:hypothetical protein